MFKRVLNLFICLYLVLFLQVNTASSIELNTGDLVLVSLPCYVCRLIEIEEQSDYSHLGVIVQARPEPLVLESWGKVQATPLSVFLRRKTKQTKALVLRLNRNSLPSTFKSKLWNTFKKNYEGLEYDTEFLWDNRDSLGREKLYCSEFVSKIFKDLGVQVKPKAMHFNQYRQDWIRYFKGQPPDGIPGVSPQDFIDTKIFTIKTQRDIL